MQDGGIVGGIVGAACAVTGAGGIVGAAFAAGEYYDLLIQEIDLQPLKNLADSQDRESADRRPRRNI
jgi:hypothetical protein